MRRDIPGSINLPDEDKLNISTGPKHLNFPAVVTCRRLSYLEVNTMGLNGDAQSSLRLGTSAELETCNVTERPIERYVS
jgi:hypothetical protein